MRDLRKAHQAAVWLLTCLETAIVVAILLTALMILWMILLSFNATFLDHASRKVNETLCAFKLTTQCKPECKGVGCRNR